MSEVPLYSASKMTTLMMSGLDGSGAVHKVWAWQGGAFGGHVPPVGAEMYRLKQSYPIHVF